MRGVVCCMCFQMCVGVFFSVYVCVGEYFVCHCVFGVCCMFFFLCVDGCFLVTHYCIFGVLVCVGVFSWNASLVRVGVCFVCILVCSFRLC